MPIGVAVTLRGDRMYAFLERLINLALPRIRDFRGVSEKSFDGRGNYTLGVREQIIFPEISFDKIDAIRGMDITIVTSARNDEEGRPASRDGDAVPQQLIATFRTPLWPTQTRFLTCSPASAMRVRNVTRPPTSRFLG